jgi:hypothetical protein
LTFGSLIVEPVNEYDIWRRVNRENFSNLFVNNRREPERLTEPPTVFCVKSSSALKTPGP